jgi:transcriptional regulator with XRE-family HTH domain
MAIGERLREKRGKEPQKTLAARSGVSQSMISQIESGDRPSPGVDVLNRLEEALQLPHGYLSYPDVNDASLDAFRRSDYGRDMQVTDDEIERLRYISWKGPHDDAPPAAWAALLEAIRRRERK